MTLIHSRTIFADQHKQKWSLAPNICIGANFYCNTNVRCFKAISLKKSGMVTFYYFYRKGVCERSKAKLLMSSRKCNGWL